MTIFIIKLTRLDISVGQIEQIFRKTMDDLKRNIMF